MGETDSTHHMCRDIYTMWALRETYQWKVTIFNHSSIDLQVSLFLQPFNPMRNKEKILVKNAANLIPDLPDFASSLPFENTLFYNFQQQQELFLIEQNTYKKSSQMRQHLIDIDGDQLSHVFRCTSISKTRDGDHRILGKKQHWVFRPNFRGVFLYMCEKKVLF